MGIMVNTNVNSINLTRTQTNKNHAHKRLFFLIAQKLSHNKNKQNIEFWYGCFDGLTAQRGTLSQSRLYNDDDEEEEKDNVQKVNSESLAYFDLTPQLYHEKETYY